MVARGSLRRMGIGSLGTHGVGVGGDGGILMLAAEAVEVVDEARVGAVKAGLEAIEVFGAGAVGDIEVAVGERGKMDVTAAVPS